MPKKGALQDRLDLTQSQLELDKDEVAAANQDLLQAGGNVHQRIQKMMQDHTNAANSRAATPPAADPLSSLHGLAEKVREWLALRKKQRFLQFAASQATSTAAELSEQRQKLATQLEASKSNSLTPQHDSGPRDRAAPAATQLRPPARQPTRLRRHPLLRPTPRPPTPPLSSPPPANWPPTRNS